MENCIIYSHQIEFEKVVQIVKKGLPKANITYMSEGAEQSLLATLKGSFFKRSKTLKINFRQRKNPSYKLVAIECPLTRNLVGMVNYIRSLPAKNEALKDKFLYKVGATNSEIPFIVKPAMYPEFESILKEITKELNGFVFVKPSHLFRKSHGQHFLNKNLDLILDERGNSEVQNVDVAIDAKYFQKPAKDYSAEQKNRREKTETFLRLYDIPVNQGLPPVATESETKLRSLKEIIDRVYALLVIALKGEGIESEYLKKLVQDKNITAFSPKERHIYQSEQLNESARVYATWRYESLYALLWVLGKVDDLKYPSDICDVQKIVDLVFHPSREEFEKAVNLRYKSVILDELDKAYRMNWACVNARIKGQTVAGKLDAGIVYERHYCFNWLTNYQNQDWDNVQTNT
jgi:hypothetical protein